MFNLLNERTLHFPCAGLCVESQNAEIEKAEFSKRPKSHKAESKKDEYLQGRIP